MAVLGDRKFWETLAYTWTQHGKGAHATVPGKVAEGLSKGETRRRIIIGTGMRRKTKDDINYYTKTKATNSVA
jgi:hypothetical protein